MWRDGREEDIGNRVGNEKNESKEKMKKQRLTDKDYRRLSRTKEEKKESEGAWKREGSGANRRGQVTVRDQWRSMGRSNRERILMRWSEQSVRSTRNGMVKESMGLKTVKKSQLQRDRGVTRKEVNDGQDGSKQVKAGLYTRIPLKTLKDFDMEKLESKRNERESVKRRALGRKNDENEILWFGERESVKGQGRYQTEKDRVGLRTRWKGIRSHERKGKTLVENVKTYSNRSRMKLLRMQSMRRSKVRRSHEKARQKKEV